jgi:hypothetical protein
MEILYIILTFVAVGVSISCWEIWKEIKWRVTWDKKFEKMKQDTAAAFPDYVIDPPTQK